MLLFLAVILFLVNRNTNESPKKMTNVFKSMTKVIDSISNTNADLYVISDNITFRNQPFISSDEKFLNFSLSDDENSIVMEESIFRNKTTSLGGGNSLSEFGSLHKKYRIFKNAEDFKIKIKRLISNSRKNDQDFAEYFPRISFSNFYLSLHDGDHEFKY